MKNNIDCTFKVNDLGEFHYCARAIIRYERKFLMIRRYNKFQEYYYPVGGHVKFGESLEKAVLREVKEETGVNCEIERLIAIHEDFFMRPEKTPNYAMTAFFIIKPNKNFLSISNGYNAELDLQSDEKLEWLDVENCQSKIIYPEFYLELILESKPNFRHIVTHSGTR